MVEQQEFDRIFNKCYLAEEKVKELEKENRELLRKNKLLVDRLIDYAYRLGIKIDVKEYGGNIL